MIVIFMYIFIGRVKILILLYKYLSNVPNVSMKPTPSTEIDLTSLPPSPKRPKKNTSPLDHLQLNDTDLLGEDGLLTNISMQHSTC